VLAVYIALEMLLRELDLLNSASIRNGVCIMTVAISSKIRCKIRCRTSRSIDVHVSKTNLCRFIEVNGREFEQLAKFGRFYLRGGLYFRLSAYPQYVQGYLQDCNVYFVTCDGVTAYVGRTNLELH
jgi:hypothetical protein